MRMKTKIALASSQNNSLTNENEEEEEELALHFSSSIVKQNAREEDNFAENKCRSPILGDTQCLNIRFFTCNKPRTNLRQFLVFKCRKFSSSQEFVLEEKMHPSALTLRIFLIF